MASRISIISAAFVLLGRQPINAIDESTAANVAARIYDDHKLDILQKNSWKFAKFLRQLNKTTAVSLNDEWSTIYQLPSDYLQAWRVHPQSDYAIYQKTIYSNQDPLILEYVANVDEDFYPPYFTILMQFAMAELLANYVTGQEPLAEYWGKKAQLQYLHCLTLDAQAQTNRTVITDDIFSAHQS